MLSIIGWGRRGTAREGEGAVGGADTASAADLQGDESGDRLGQLGEEGEGRSGVDRAFGVSEQHDLAPRLRTPADPRG